MFEWAIPVATVISGGLGAAVATSYFAISKDHIFAMRAKAEELFLCVETFETEFSIIALLLKQVIDGDITWDQMLDLQLGDKSADTSSFKRLKMLISLYFPSVKGDFERLISARSEFNAQRAKFKQAYIGGYPRVYSWEKHFQHLMEEISASAEAMREHIARNFEPYRRLGLIVPNIKVKMRSRTSTSEAMPG